MNKKQWYVLALVFFMFGNLFILLDLNNGFLPVGGIGNPCNTYESSLYERYQSGEIIQEEYFEILSERADAPLDEYDVQCIIGGELYEPFIYLFNIGWMLILVLAWLEPKEKKAHKKTPMELSSFFTLVAVFLFASGFFNPFFFRKELIIGAVISALISFYWIRKAWKKK